MFKTHIFWQEFKILKTIILDQFLTRHLEYSENINYRSSATAPLKKSLFLLWGWYIKNPKFHEHLKCAYDDSNFASLNDRLLLTDTISKESCTTASHFSLVFRLDKM